MKNINTLSIEESLVLQGINIYEESFKRHLTASSGVDFDIFINGRLREHFENINVEAKEIFILIYRCVQKLQSSNVEAFRIIYNPKKILFEGYYKKNNPNNHEINVYNFQNYTSLKELYSKEKHFKCDLIKNVDLCFFKEIEDDCKVVEIF